MPTPRDREKQEVQDANAAGRTPVVFVHGLWLLPSSWDRWRAHFKARGYATTAPGCPSASLRDHPESPRGR